MQKFPLVVMEHSVRVSLLGNILSNYMAQVLCQMFLRKICLEKMSLAIGS